MNLSILMITKNAEEVIADALNSVKGLRGELLVADDGSTDGTIGIVIQYGGRVFELKNKNLGERIQWLISKAQEDWIFILDSDERVSKKLSREIKEIATPHRGGVRNDKNKGYSIPYQNYVFGKPVYWGGERYNKVRFFRKGYGKVTPVSLHEEVFVKGKIGALHGVIHHHSFRTPIQLFTKFTKYASIAAQEKKRACETLSFGKLFLYAPHMFWARFVKEKGYKDGWRGFVLAFAFSYMETLMYWILLFL